MGRSLGRGMREFKDSVTNDSKPREEAEEPKAIRPAEPVAAVAVPEQEKAA